MQKRREQTPTTRLRKFEDLFKPSPRFLSSVAVGAVGPAPIPHANNGLPRATILMTDAGGGHRSAARSLAEALAGQAHVTILNLLDDFTPFPFNQFSPTYGPFVNRAPWLYHLVYRATEDRRFVVAAENACYPLVKRQLSTALLATAPDLVISVHPLLTDVPLRLLRRAGNRAPFVTVVTDPVTVHPAWLCPGVDMIVVATHAAYLSALENGVPPSKVRVVGLPIRKAFQEMRDRPKPALRAHLGLDPDCPLVLLSGGGAGIGNVLSMARAAARQLAQAHYPAQMAIIAGRNELLLRQLRAETWPIPVTPLGFVEQMAEWMAASDVLVTKAGPGTLAEAFCVGVPVLVTDFIPGQETGNISWIERSGAGTFIRDADKVAETVVDWLRPGNPDLERMAARARALGRPEATSEIAGLALGLCEQLTSL